MGNRQKKKKSTPGLLGDNRKARFLYSVEDSLECGIELKGAEVKSMKSAHFSFTDAFAEIFEGELWLKNFHINQYTHTGSFFYDSDRPRRLLAHKKEILKLAKRVNEKGLTLIPLKFYMSRGYVKIEIGLCRGKKKADKRDSIKNRDLQRDMDRESKYQRYS